MQRRELLKSALLAGVAEVAAPMLNLGRFRLFASQPETYSDRTIELVGRSTVIDMLGLLTLDWDKFERWKKTPSAFAQADFDRLKSSGISVFHPAVDLPAAHPYEATLDWIDGWKRFLFRHRDQFTVITESAGIERSRGEGKIGVLLGMQNANHFRTVDDVRLFYALGQRVTQLTYNQHNSLGCGCCEARDRGLTAYGAQIVAEMNRLGMAVDVSHAGDRTTLDAFETSSKPVLITHANCRALVNHPRCKPDNVIKAMAATGSVMGLTGIRMFVSSNGKPTVHDLLDHYDHVARLVGVEHLGIGSDTDLEGCDRAGVPFDISGLNHPLRIYDLTEGLIRRRYSNSSIELILGGNFARVLKEILS